MKVFFSQTFDKTGFMFNGENVPVYSFFEKAGLYDVGGILTSYYHIRERKDINAVEKLQHVFSNRYECLMIDSGAYSWYRKNVLRKQKSKYGGIDKMPRQMGCFTWATSKEFEQFFDDYCSFLKQMKVDELQVPYVVLDVIGNAELTWKMFVEMKRRGFRPIPVWHYGEDFEWLKRYVLDEDCEYIGIGGVVSFTDGSRRSVLAFAKIFSYLVKLVGRDVVLRKKFHLFAQTGMGVLKEVPFDTVDSSTPVMYYAYGKIMVNSGERIVRLPVSVREKKRTQIVCTSRESRSGVWLGLLEEKLCRVFTLVTGIETSNVYEVLTSAGEDYNIRASLCTLMFFDFVRDAFKITKEERLERLLGWKGV